MSVILESIVVGIKVEVSGIRLNSSRRLIMFPRGLPSREARRFISEGSAKFSTLAAVCINTGCPPSTLTCIDVSHGSSRELLHKCAVSIIQPSDRGIVAFTADDFGTRPRVRTAVRTIRPTSRLVCQLLSLRPKDCWRGEILLAC